MKRMYVLPVTKIILQISGNFVTGFWDIYFSETSRTENVSMNVNLYTNYRIRTVFLRV